MLLAYKHPIFGPRHPSNQCWVRLAECGCRRTKSQVGVATRVWTVTQPACREAHGIDARTNDESAVDIPEHEDAGEGEAADAEPVAYHAVRRALQRTKCRSCMFFKGLFTPHSGMEHMPLCRRYVAVSQIRIRMKCSLCGEGDRAATER